MKRKIVWLILSCLVAVALVVTSCGTAADDDVVVEEEEEVVEAEDVVVEEDVVVSEEEEVVVVAPAEEEPVYGGILNVLGYDPGGWDPVLTQWQSPTTLPVTDPLVTLDWWKGPAGTNEWAFDSPGTQPPHDILTGALAESWEVYPTRVIYYLRQGVMWQDKPGIMAPREVTADDIVWNFERSVATPGHMLWNWTGIGIIITVLDRYTVEIAWEKPSYTVPLEVLGTFASMIPPEVIEQFGSMTDWRNVTGTGAWKLTDYVSGSVIIYERNPNWFMKDPQGRSLPYLDGFKILILPDTSTIMSALRTGQLDLVAGYSSIAWEDAESLRDTNPELEWRSKLAGAFGIALDQKAPPFGPSDDPDALKVRRAASMAIDRDAIVEYYYQGNAMFTTSFMHPAFKVSALYLENLPASSQELFEYNPEEARRLLAEAGYPDGIDIELSSFSWMGDYMSLYKAYWDDVGIRTELKLRDYGAHAALQYGFQMEGAFTVYYWWGFDVGWVWNRNEDGVPNMNNFSSVDNFELDELIRELSREMDWNRRVELAAASMLIGIDQAYQIVLPTPFLYTYWQPWVGGYSGEDHAGMSRPYDMLDYIWLDQDLKDAAGY